MTLQVTSKSAAGVVNSIKNTDFTYTIKIKYEPCRSAKLDVGSVELKEMESFVKNSEVVE